MDVKQLQYFVVSVDMGSFHSAAEVLITTQPNVSKIVKSLETELNMTLLKRDRNGVTPTKEGEIIYRYSIEVLTNMRIITDFRDEQKIERLSICSVPSNTLSIYLAKFYNKISHEKEIQMDFCESNVEDIMKKVHRREAELGFVYISKRNMSSFKRHIKNKGLKFFEIKKTPLYLYVGKKSPLYGNEYIEEKDVRNIKLIQRYEEQYSLYNHLGHLKEDIFLSGEKSYISYTNSDHFLMHLLKNTEYGSIDSCFIENKHREDGIQAIPILSAENSISFGYIKRVRDSLSTVAEEFISYLNEECILNEER